MIGYDYMIPMSGVIYHKQYCPSWFANTEAALEVGQNYNHYETNNLSVYWEPGRIPAVLDAAIRAFKAGYMRGFNDRPKPETSGSGNQTGNG